MQRRWRRMGRVTVPAPGDSAPASPADDRRDGLAALARGLAAESALLVELKAALLEQRHALAANDAAGLEQVVQSIGRTLLTLREARRQRGLLMELVAGDSGVRLGQIAATLMPADAAIIAEGARALNEAAVAASREVSINQTALRRAISSGEQLLQHLLTAPTQEAGYPESAGVVQSGLLFNHQA